MNTKTPRVDSDERNYPQPDYLQLIQFEGCTMGVINQEDYAELYNKARTIERELTAVTEQLTAAREELAELKEEYGTWWAQKRIAIDELKEVTEQRDEARRLAEKYRNLSCDSQEEADETLLPWENNQPKPESKDPHRFCRGGGGNNFHCGCKYDG